MNCSSQHSQCFSPFPVFTWNDGIQKTLIDVGGEWMEAGIELPGRERTVGTHPCLLGSGGLEHISPAYSPRSKCSSLIGCAFVLCPLFFDERWIFILINLPKYINSENVLQRTFIYTLSLYFIIQHHKMSSFFSYRMILNVISL